MSPVVKGVSRQVIVVKEPDPRFFEQAIFILREDAFGAGVTAEAVLQEARRVADGYVRRHTGAGRLWRRLPAPRFLFCGKGRASAGTEGGVSASLQRDLSGIQKEEMIWALFPHNIPPQY